MVTKGWGCSMSANQVFQSWLEKKDIERKKRVKEERTRLVREQEMTTDRIQKGHEAYYQWIMKIRQLDELKRKEMIKRRQYEKLITEEKMKHKQQNEKEYLFWKQKKDEEKLIETDTNNNNGVNERMLSTPSLSGYISVWSCDEEIADIMLSSVQRPLSCTLTES